MKILDYPFIYMYSVLAQKVKMKVGGGALQACMLFASMFSINMYTVLIMYIYMFDIKKTTTMSLALIGICFFVPTYLYGIFKYSSGDYYKKVLIMHNIHSDKDLLKYRSWGILYMLGTFLLFLIVGYFINKARLMCQDCT